MIHSLAYKADFAQTVTRFAAWWEGDLLDRPPVTVRVTPSRPYQGPPANHATERARWLDVEYVVDAAIATMEQRDYVGDTFPIFWPNVGPEISATPYGCELTYTADTSWSTPVVQRCADWQQILTRTPDFTNLYWQTVERMTDYALARCDGRYIVGLSDLHGNYDILAALRDPMQLCIDLMDCPALVRQAGRHVAQGFVAGFERLYAKVRAAGFGTTTWLPFYHEGPAYVPSCDFWCMLSPQMAQEMILPDLLVEMAPMERTIFHLDGPQALRHLDLLLDLPQLNAIQWVYGAGRGPAARWIAVYQRILRAGKSVQLLARDPADALAVLAETGTRGVWVTVEEPFASVEEAAHFVDHDIGGLRR
ncbi:MAG TPA: hypothetical protein P5121_11945 [Caldilineaceae bacterium]|nr:hypothetical protein [Caldilineaceae bacterium]